ncbi:MAG: ATP-binding protein [Oscillospiraceae bacterium]|nr:ATP-binding protein [Oscillospiraceae bacterium]
MDNDYIKKMQTKENLCLAYERQAEDEFDRNGGKPSKEQCRLLQQAAYLRYEMARMSIGEERYYQQRRLRELNEQIKKIAIAIDPEMAKRIAEAAQKSKEAKATPAGAAKPSTNKAAAAPAKPSTEVSDAEVSTWFKEMPAHSFEDVSGMSELKEQLRGCIQDLHIAELKEFLKMKKIHSFFFYGPPGCGKTYIIKAFAHELMDQDYKFMSLEGSDVLSKYVGDAEKTVSRVFEEAEKNAPCIIFFDEVDGVCKSRSLPDLPNYAASLTTAFLTGYNRIDESKKPIIFIGATNYPRQVDNAMLDRVELVRVPLPDPAARAAKFERDLKKIIHLADDLDYDYMAQETENYNYRDIDRLVSKIKAMILKAVMKQYGTEKAALEALKSGEYRIDQAFFNEARANCLPTPKDSILKELDAWEEQVKRGMEE